MIGQDLVDNSVKLRTELRRLAGAETSYPVGVVVGGKPPCMDGDGWCFTTKTGIPISHPSAYAAKGWSSMVYNASTRRVIVGEEWLRQYLLRSLERGILEVAAGMTV